MVKTSIIVRVIALCIFYLHNLSFLYICVTFLGKANAFTRNKDFDIRFIAFCSTRNLLDTFLHAKEFLKLNYFIS